MTDPEKIAAPDKIGSSYAARLLRFTLLAPDVVVSILDGRQPTELTLALLMEPFPMEWKNRTGRSFNSSGAAK